MKKTKKILYTPPILDLAVYEPLRVLAASDWDTYAKISDNPSNYNPLYDGEL